MAELMLGKAGARTTGAVYLFKNYAVLSAYILQGGQLLLEYACPLFGVVPSMVPAIAGPVTFVLLAGGLLFVSSDKQIQQSSSVLSGCLLVSFFALLVLGVPNLDASLLLRADAAAVVPAIPILVLSIAYQNIVPTICYQLGCDIQKIRTAIVVGSSVPVSLAILWNLIIIGSVSP